MPQGKIIGYVRVSTYDQNPDRQLDGIHIDKLFTDKASGKNTDRPGLHALMQYAREDDTVVIHSMDRLARNLDNLRSIVQSLTSRNTKVRFIKEGLEFTGEDAPLSNLLLSVMGAFAEFERALIKERQGEGIELAKLKGVYKGRKKSLNKEQIKQLWQRANSGATKAALARELGISRETLYQYLRAG